MHISSSIPDRLHEINSLYFCSNFARRMNSDDHDASFCFEKKIQIHGIPAAPFFCFKENSDLWCTCGLICFKENPELWMKYLLPHFDQNKIQIHVFLSSTDAKNWVQRYCKHWSQGSCGWFEFSTSHFPHSIQRQEIAIRFFRSNDRAWWFEYKKLSLDILQEQWQSLMFQMQGIVIGFF